MANEMTARRKAFVTYYADPASDAFGNATQSAIRAGFSSRTAKSQGQRLLTFVDVRQAIEVKRMQIQAEMDITRDEVIANARWLIEHGKTRSIGADVRAGNEQLCKLGGYFHEDARSDHEMPRIIINYPEQFAQEAKTQPVKLHAG